MNYTIARCGHHVPAVGMEGSKARMECEMYPCDRCNQEERDVLAELLRAHPSWSERPVSVNDCLGCMWIDAGLKERYLAVYERNNPPG